MKDRCPGLMVEITDPQDTQSKEHKIKHLVSFITEVQPHLPGMTLHWKTETSEMNIKYSALKIRTREGLQLLLLLLWPREKTGHIIHCSHFSPPRSRNLSTISTKWVHVIKGQMLWFYLPFLLLLAILVLNLISLGGAIPKFRSLSQSPGWCS